MQLFGAIFKFAVLVFRRPRLLLFLLVFVIGVGGIGVWIPLSKLKPGDTNLELDVYRNLATYLIAIVITSFAERFILRKPEGDDRTLAVFAFGLGVAGVVPAILILSRDSLDQFFGYARIAVAATLWLWFIALADSPAFEEGDAGSTLGGKVRV